MKKAPGKRFLLWKTGPCAMFFLLLLFASEGCAGIQRIGWNQRFLKYGSTHSYFVGMDLQQVVSDSSINFHMIIDSLSRYDINVVRIWTIANFLSDWSPNLYPYEKKGDKFDLFKWDKTYWMRLDHFLKYADSKNIIVQISIFEVSGPLLYFGERILQPYPFHGAFNHQGFGSPNKEGRFLPDFYDLDYVQNGIRLRDLQKALIDKIILETEDNPNVFFELMNEFPGPKEFLDEVSSRTWALEMLRHINSRTDKLVTIHAHGLGYDPTPAELEKSSAPYWSKRFVDGLNFHLYSGDPNRISKALHGHQRKKKLLFTNEGGEYYDLDRSQGYPDYRLLSNPGKLNREIRALWGNIMAAAYYLFYHGPVHQIGKIEWQAAAQAAQAARHILEQLPFWKMKPVRSDGNEYDRIVLQGPCRNKQVLAQHGQAYLVYFWSTDGMVSNQDVKIQLPAGHYRFRWFDTRVSRPPLKSGTISGAGSIPAPPPPPAWNPASGVVLLLKKIDIN